MAGLLDNEGGFGAGLLGNIQRGLAQIADPQRSRHTLTDDIKEFEYAKRQGFGGTLQDWMQRKRSGAGEYALVPTWGTGPDGKPALVQLGKSGDAISPKLPEGFSPSKGIEKIDLGDSWGFVNKQSGETLRVVPKNIEAKERAEEVGKAEGQAVVNLPKIESAVNQTLATIKQVREHPGKNSWAGGIGWGSVLPPVPSSSGVGFVGLVEQLRGKTFLQAFEALKGGGAITETEGLKGEQAQARLQRAQSPADFEQALKDLEDVVTEGRRVAREKTGRGRATATPAPASGGGLPRVSSPDEARRLPKGTRFLDPNGVERVVP